MAKRKDTAKFSTAALNSEADAPASFSADAAATNEPKAELPYIESPQTQPGFEPEDEGEPQSSESHVPAGRMIERRSLPNLEARMPVASFRIASEERDASFNTEASYQDGPSIGPDAPDTSNSRRMRKFALLAASVALAAAIGAGGGALGAWSLMPEQPTAAATAAAAAPAAAAASNSLALRQSVAQLRSEIASLRTSIESANKNATAQFRQASERFDRIERAQAEPTAKINKAVETLDRIDRRTDTTAKDTTGAINTPTQLASAQPPQPQPQPQVQGWVLRDVQHGVALLQGRFGVIEVEAGDMVPGLGRIDSIKRQDGRWVVLTPRGVIR